ncbi:hypothetical protein ACFLYD_01050 [Chloroflexota bacterium]
MTKMTKDFDSILEQCLSQISAGKATISSCLDRYPGQAGDLEPLLRAAKGMWAIPQPVLAPEARAGIEARLLDAVEARPRIYTTARRHSRSLSNLRWAAIGFSAIFVAVLLLAVLVDRVGETLPGSPLHPIKLAAEETWLWLAPAREEPELRLRFARRRLDEVAALNGQGAVDPSLIEGMTQETEGALTIVEDLPPAGAVPLVDDVRALIQDQKQTLSTLLEEAPPTSKGGVVVALEANAGQENRAQVLQSTLPMPPALMVLEMANPTSVPEPGGVVEFTVRVTNDGAEEVTLTSLTNEIRGNPNAQGACSIPPEGVRLKAGEFYECGFTAFVFRNAGETETDSVMVVAIDDDGNEARVSATAAVTVADVVPSIAVSKIVDRSQVPEPGDMVWFTVGVSNEGVESIVLTSLVDDVHGDLRDRGTCSLPPEGISLAPDERYECTFVARVLGNGGESESDTVTAVAADDEGNRVKAGGRATVVITDMLPEIAVVKTADPSRVQEPGDTVQFAVRVINNSVEGISLTALVDDIHGDLDGRGTCSVPSGGIALDVGERYECAFSADVAGNAGDSETDSVVAFASDDEGNKVHATDSASVLVTDVLPVIAVSKTASPSSVLEPGDTVEFTVRLSNSSVEDVVFTSLVDDVRGNLNGQGTCVVPKGGLRLSPDGLYKCTYSVDVDGNAGDSETGAVTVTAVDDDGNTVRATDSATVIVRDAAPEIAVIKIASPRSVPEPGDVVQFTVQVANHSVEDVELTSLVDDILGNLNGQGTCYLPARGMSLSPGASYRCAFSLNVVGNAGEDQTDSVTAVAADDEGNRVKATDSATVRVTDVLPAIVVSKTAAPSSVPEPGDQVQFVVRVRNISVEDVALITLVDDVHGNLDGKGTCSVPQAGLSLEIGESYECTFGTEMEGNAGDSETDTVTAEVSDDEGNRAKASDSATVTVEDVLPAIEVSKTASPSTVPEPGGTVEFSVRVVNSSVEDVTLMSLVDDVYGDLNDQGTCSIPRSGMVLSPEESYKCAFSASVAGNAGDIVADIVTAQATDDEGNTAKAAGSAAVRITDVLPAIMVSKLAEPISVPEPGGTVHFTIRVTNDSIEDVTLVSLVDDVHGNLEGRGTCTWAPAGASLVPGGAYECGFSAEVTGNAGDTEISVVTARASDDEENLAEASDSSSVGIIDALPVIAVNTTANPDSVLEPGGMVRFTVSVANVSGEAVILASLVDNLHGKLDGLGTCSLPPEGIALSAGGAYECAFSMEVFGNAGDAQTVTVAANAFDDDGNQAEASDSTTVTIIDVPPALGVALSADPGSVPEPGGMVQLTVRVTNQSVEHIMLISLMDSRLGNLSGQGTCSVPSQGVTLALGETYVCVFDAEVSGNAGEGETDTVTASAIDDEGNVAEASDSATVTITDVPPVIAVSKMANPSSVPEPGGLVQFTVRVINGSVENITLVSLADDAHGDLGSRGTCSVPPAGIRVNPGGWYECTFTAEVSGSAGYSETDTVRAVAVDDEGNVVQASGSAVVTVSSAPPTSDTSP